MTGRTLCVLGAAAVLLVTWFAPANVIAQERTMALRAAWVIDATGRRPIADGVVIVRGNRIEAVGPRASVTIPGGAETIDLPGQTLMPGLIDTHSHLGNRSMYPSPFGGPGQRNAPASEQMIKMVRHARVQLLCGITTLRQCGEPGLTDLVLKRAIAVGVHPGPRIIGGGEHIGPEVDTAEAIRKKVGEYFRAGAEWIKMTHGDLTPTTAQIPPALLKAGVDEAHKYGLKVTVHAVGRWGSAVKTSVEAGADNIEHVRPMTEEIVQLMLKHGAHRDTINIKEAKDGIDFFFSARNQAERLVDFLNSVAPIKVKKSQELISQDVHTSAKSFKFTFSVEIVPICKDDLVALPIKLARQAGNISPLALCYRIGTSINLFDPNTLQTADISSPVYWRAPFTPLADAKELVEFIVMDIEPIGPRKSRWVLAEATVARASDLGVNDNTYFSI